MKLVNWPSLDAFIEQVCAMIGPVLNVEHTPQPMIDDTTSVTNLYIYDSVSMEQTRKEKSKL